MNESTAVKSWWPTRKWWAATILAVAGILSTWAAEGWDWTDPLSGAAITLVAQRLLAYMVPNQDTEGGVPTTTGSKL